MESVVLIIVHGVLSKFSLGFIPLQWFSFQNQHLVQRLCK